MWMKWLQFPALIHTNVGGGGLESESGHSWRCSWWDFALSCEGMHVLEERSLCLWMQSPARSAFSLLSFIFAILSIVLFLLFFSCWPWAWKFYIIGNIYVAGDLVISLCFSWWIFTVFISAGLFDWALTIFKTLLCCKADFFSSFWSQLSCLFVWTFSELYSCCEVP